MTTTDETIDRLGALLAAGEAAARATERRKILAEARLILAALRREVAAYKAQAARRDEDDGYRWESPAERRRASAHGYETKEGARS